MKPREFHALAVELARETSPAKRRSAISRAYYSAFHVGLQTLRALGFVVSRGRAGHGEVSRCLSNSADVDVVVAAEKLADLHVVRNRADYQLDRTDVEQSAHVQAAVITTELIIDCFDAILTSPRRPQIQSTIAAWRKSNGYP